MFLPEAKLRNITVGMLADLKEKAESQLPTL